jgi:signal transduction histidine kinase
MTLHAQLIAIVQQLSRCHDLPEVMTVLRQAARDLSRADGVTIVLRDADQCYYAEENAISPLWKGRRFPLRACISGWCMLHREQVVIPDIYADPRIPHDAYRPTFVQSLAMVPICSEDPIGAIGAYWASHHTADVQELEVLQALADSASIAIANVTLIDSLKGSNRRKDAFLSMLAHELRNPLAPLRNALHLLRLYPDRVTLERACSLMGRQLDHLTRLVDGLLDMARLTSGKVVLHPERLDLGNLLRQGAQDYRSVLASAGVALCLELPETPVWVSGDPLRLNQVLGNLLDNAAKFTPRGGEVTVHLTTDNDACQAILTVHDTGIGIEPEILPHIFEVFAQADQSLDRSGGGLGLGLAVAKSLLELHGGTIQAASGGTGHGTTFVVCLPHEKEPLALTTGLPSALPTACSRHVLVVEDNRDAAESLRMLLETCGYSVAVAHSGPAGVEAARTVPPDVVLCDIGLPGMNGYAVATALRHSPGTAAARLIAVTGYGNDEDRGRALEAGFDAHLVKPVDPVRLLGQIAATL